MNVNKYIFSRRGLVRARNIHRCDIERKLWLFNFSEGSSKFAVFLSSLAGIVFLNIFYYESAYTWPPIFQGNQIIRPFNAWVCCMFLVVIFLEYFLNQILRFDNLNFSWWCRLYMTPSLSRKKIVIAREVSGILFRAEIIFLFLASDFFFVQAVLGHDRSYVPTQRVYVTYFPARSVLAYKVQI